jgi:hypothetical protein
MDLDGAGAIILYARNCVGIYDVPIIAFEKARIA